MARVIRCDYCGEWVSVKVVKKTETQDYLICPGCQEQYSVSGYPPAEECRCDYCNGNPCHCDRDDRNPVDMTKDAWLEFYAAHPDFDIGDDHSMDG